LALHLQNIAEVRIANAQACIDPHPLELYTTGSNKVMRFKFAICLAGQTAERHGPRFPERTDGWKDRASEEGHLLANSLCNPTRPRTPPQIIVMASGTPNNCDDFCICGPWLDQIFIELI